jgi:hypothetical protein
MGYREDRRGNWFGGGTSMVYVDKEVCKFYIVNEQEGCLIRVRDEKQIELMNCLLGPQLRKEDINWLTDSNGGRFTYFDSVDEYKSFQEKEFK